MEQWLTSLHFSGVVNKFCKQNGIDGLTLLLLKEEDLRQAPLAIERLGDRKKLWYHIRSLQCQEKDFYSLLNTPTCTSNHSSLAPTHLLEPVEPSSRPAEEKALFKSSKGEKRKTLVSFVYALISGIWTSFIMVVVHNRVPNVQK